MSWRSCVAPQRRAIRGDLGDRFQGVLPHLRLQHLANLQALFVLGPPWRDRFRRADAATLHPLCQVATEVHLGGLVAPPAHVRRVQVVHEGTVDRFAREDHAQPPPRTVDGRVDDRVEALGGGRIFIAEKLLELVDDGHAKEERLLDVDKELRHDHVQPMLEQTAFVALGVQKMLVVRELERMSDV